MIAVFFTFQQKIPVSLDENITIQGYDWHYKKKRKSVSSEKKLGKLLFLQQGENGDTDITKQYHHVFLLIIL